MTNRIDKDSLPLNKPRRTPDHPTKSHVVKTKVDGKEKIIRFGEQGASTAGKPKAGESERMTAKRDSFKARHAANIAKGPASAAYWANKVKWADGGSVRTNYAEGDSVSATPRKAALGKIADALKSAQEYTSQYEVSPWVPLLGGTGVDEMLSLPGAASLMDDASYHGAGALLRGGNTVNTFKVDPRIVDVIDVAGTVTPIAGALTKIAKKGLKSAVKKAVADEVVTPKEQKMLQGFYRGYAGQNPDTAELFITPQKRVADFYAEKRSSQIGGTPHAEMILIDQLTGNQYGHSTLGTGANPPMMTMARKIKADDVKGRTQLYATGGAVKVINKLAKVLMGGSDEVALTAAQRAEAGRKAAELIKSQPQVKASEALGQLMEKGFKRTTTTQADRTRVGGGNIGGAPFPAISEADAAYANKVWGVMDEGTAARLKNLTTPDTAWTTMLGSANQLKTNPIVFDKLKRQFLTSMKQGNLPPELEARINHNLALTFGEGASIRDPGIWKQADTFEKRAALADLMMGQGIAPKKGGVALGGEKSGRGVIFRPTDTLIRETEPSLLHSEHGGDVPTFAAGPRLFTLEKESVYRPDLHPGFPTLITGKDLEYNVMPTPTEIYLRDWHAKFKRDNPERYPPFKTEKQAGPGYYDLALGVKGEGLPSQEINDEYIRHLIREGYAEGGPVGYGIGGVVSKGLAKLAKKVLQESSSEVLPAAKREEGKKQFLEPSKVKQRLYHGTGDDIKEFRNSRIGAMGPGTYLAESPQNASHYANVTTRKGSANQPNVMPVYVQTKNPFVISDVNKSHEELFKYFDPEGKLTDDEVIKKVLDAGYDSIYAKGTGEINVLDPRKIKSAIGNRGTYDVSEPDITKAKGGSVNMAEGGLVGDPVMAYDPFQVDAIMNSINEPRGYAEGGEVHTPDIDFKEDPEALQLYKHAMKQLLPNQEDTFSSASTGVRGRVKGGDLSVGLDVNRMTQRDQDQLMKALSANYNVNLGDLNLNTRVEKPLDAKDVYVGMMNGSIPVGTGRAMLGVMGLKSPYGSEVLGYNAGWSGKVGPGNLNVNVNKPKRGDYSAQVQYAIPFAKGGKVKKEMRQVSNDQTDDFIDDIEIEKLISDIDLDELRKSIAENDAAIADLTPMPTEVETGSDPMLLDVYPRRKREMEANPHLYEYGTARLKDEEFVRPMLSDDASREAWLEYKLRPRGQTDFSDKYPQGMELPMPYRRTPLQPKRGEAWDEYYAEGGTVRMAEGGDAEAKARDLYAQIKRSGEAIDEGGLKYWTDRAQSGQQSPEELQKEFMAAADAADDPYYEVNKMYQRTAQAPDTEGFNYWVNRAQQEKLTPQQLGSQFIGGMPAITAAQERSGFGLGGQYGTYNGLPMLYAPEVDKAMQQEQRVTGDLVNVDNAIGWDPSSMSGELSRGAAAAGVYRAPLGMGMQGGSQFAGDLLGTAKQYGIDPAQYMQSAPGQYGQQTSSLDENALYNALNDKMKDYYAVQGYVPPAGTENSAFNRTDIGGDHARVMYQRIGDRLVPMEDTLQYSNMQRAPKYSWTDYIAPAAIVAAPWALPYLSTIASAVNWGPIGAEVGKGALIGAGKSIIQGQNPITGAIQGGASGLIPSPFAEGGSVQAYDADRIDAIVNQFM